MGLRQDVSWVGALDLGSSRPSPLVKLDLDSTMYPGVDRETTLLIPPLNSDGEC